MFLVSILLNDWADGNQIHIFYEASVEKKEQSKAYSVKKGENPDADPKWQK